VISTSRSDGRTIVALVDTRDRRELLLSRAIPSVLRQTRLPDRLVVVVDHSKEEMSGAEMAALARQIQSVGDKSVSVTVLRNVRTARRAAGAWNTGIDQLHRDARLLARPELCFVAILDDDDAWEPDHLEMCLEEAVAGDCGMVASGLIRHESPDDQGHRHAIPQVLDAREQFMRGQHIQGSNLFVRLDAILKAGCFDEHLPSCTDRDLCIRLAALPDLRFGRTEKHTVHHFADVRSDRLSAPSSAAKLDGLTRFWRKYADHFDEDARGEAAKRAHERFGWSLQPPEVRVTDIPPLLSPPRRVGMVIGFVTDAKPRDHVHGLLDDLHRLASDPGISRVRVVVIENGPLPSGDERPLRALVDRFRADGLDIHLVTIEQQREDWAQGRLIDTPDPTRKRLPIAVTRTVLNTYVARAMADIPNAWAWILDDDKRLAIHVDRGDGIAVSRPSPDLSTLCALQDAGVDVVIGPDTEAAPLPFTATLRVQLVDLNNHLRLLGSSAPNAELPDRSCADFVARAILRDTYYDLSKYTEHLETPFSLPRETNRRNAAETLAFVASKIDRLLAGEAIFRPLRVSSLELSPSSGVTSAQRGGSTIFFNPRVLLEYPQTLARFGDRYVRRSDILISQLMRDQLGLNIVMHPAAGVRHDRSSTKRAKLENETLWEDVLGYALYRAANEVMQQRLVNKRREPLLAWTSTELDTAVGLVKKYISERLAALTLNGWRIVGLAESVRHLAARLAQAGSRWAVGEHTVHLARIREEMDRICGNFKPSAVAEFADRIRNSVPDADIRAAFTSMDGLISEYRATLGDLGDIDQGLAASRERRARALLKAVYRVKSARLLGAGGEGIVFTDEDRVYKVFDLLKRRPNHDTLATLTHFRDQFEHAKHLYPLARVEVKDGTLLVVYPFEPSEPYAGGRGTEIIGLLRECKANGIVFRNMHPKNLRVPATGLKLIDYGSDVRSFTDAGYRSMAERAWLTWRWPHRADLEELMRRALTDKALPELDGFSRFWMALNEDKPSATRIVAAAVDDILLKSPAKRVLDYGCGKKARSARRLAEAGLQTVGFDPGERMPAKWAEQGPVPKNLILTTDRITALSHAPFDAAVCSLVICELDDGSEYEQVLADLRASVRDDGLLVISFCNPFGTFGGPTSLHRRRDLPAGMTYEDTFWYTENAETGAGRREFHRPLARVERDLLRHGIQVDRRVESRTVDTERFEPASDFITLVCRPIPAPQPPRKVSLVIKTCAMEAATIERQVAHLVAQLEGPRTFDERVLAIDSLRDGFVRQHAGSDWNALQEAGERLLRRGIIDRIVQGPGVGGESRRIVKEWFGIDSDKTHTSQGAPLATPLLAMETCTGDYILQVDSDLLISRGNRVHDYLGEMIAAIEATPLAVTVSLNIPQPSSQPFTPGNGGGPWRVEARGCLLHKARLMAARPFPNQLDADAPQHSWHRSIDIAAAAGHIVSMRGGDAQTAFIHPPNEFKRSVMDWMLLMDLVEQGHMPAEQMGRVELVGGPLLWVPRNRSEPFVFVITGRNVPPGRAARCLESLASQHRHDWGAVIIDDGSSELARHSLRLAIEPWRERVTLIQPRERRGQLANMTLAIRHICTNPDSVIITLDLDDALIGSSVLDRLGTEYLKGADVTVGSMLRTDKHAEYPVAFDTPRQSRGGNVWQHLRTFRKRLFDAIPDHDLKLGTRYVDIAVDWAFMLPIVEMAERPAWIREPLYLYEPSGLGKGSDRFEREQQIAAIVAKSPRRPQTGASKETVLDPQQMSADVWPQDGGVLFLRHGERPSFAGLNAAEKDAVRLTDQGRNAALRLGKALGSEVLLASSPVLRAVETAAAIAEAMGVSEAEVRQIDALVNFRIADTDAYELVKRRLGWTGLMTAWMDGSLDRDILIPCHDVARSAIDAALTAAEAAGRSRVVAITHDFMIMALLASLRGVRVTAVPYLGGVFVRLDEAQIMRKMEVIQ
jgi:broad specificity phosphatase PhoE/SAM-dependent methyltransferase